jgi:glycosyltransferase involved in cell wall biosynthesis
MKVLLNCHVPFMLAHGGAQVQIEQTKAALEQIGVETAFLEWWNDKQTADVLHHFGAIPPETVRQAQKKGWKVVTTILLSEIANRPRNAVLLRRMLIRAAAAVPVPQAFRPFWEPLRLCDRVVVSLEAEKQILVHSYGVSEQRVRMVPLGLREAFLKAGAGPRSGDYLISHGTITPIKRSVELARLAAQAQVPILFVGKPFAESDDYWAQFRGLVDDKYVRYRAHVGTAAEMINLLQQARGFVLMSRFENWSLATDEAAACGLPLLLADLPWSRERFGQQASYFPQSQPAAAAVALRSFYEQCATAAPPKVRLFGWRDVAEILRTVYTEDTAKPR